MHHFRWVIGLILLLLMPALACAGSNGNYEETFDSIGDWGAGDSGDAIGNVSNGVYEMNVLAEDGLYWSTAGESLGSGTYTLETTQVAGTVDNGYGMMFKVDEEKNNFYLFEVSSDGFVWIGWCEGGCSDTAENLVGDGWVESKAVNEGLNATNTLRVEVDGNNLTFSVNGQEVGQITDDSSSEEKGDIGILVETLGQGDVKVNFDNFKFTPPQSE